MVRVRRKPGKESRRENFISMKKIILLSFLATVMLNKLSAQEKMMPTICNYKPETKHFIKTLNSMTNFISNIKNSVSANEWNYFTSEADNEKGLSAFDVFGQNSKQMQNEYLVLINDASIKFTQLLLSVDPETKKSVGEVKSLLQQEINCYLTDTIENNFVDFLNLHGKAAPLNLSAGPCEREARTCIDNAANSYTQNMINCGFGGAAVYGILSSGWWGVGSGLACALVANVRHNNAKWTCIENYVDCLD